MMVVEVFGLGTVVVVFSCILMSTTRLAVVQYLFNNCFLVDIIWLLSVIRWILSV